MNMKKIIQTPDFIDKESLYTQSCGPVSENLALLYLAHRSIRPAGFAEKQGS
jgi:hypothetical protein